VGVCSELLSEQRPARAGRRPQIRDGPSVTDSQVLTVILIRLSQINNAGCMVNQRELTEEGLEKNFATNTLGKKEKSINKASLNTRYLRFSLFKGDSRSRCSCNRPIKTF